MSTSTPNKTAVSSFYKSVSHGDFTAATNLFSENLTWLEPPFPGHVGGTFQGKEYILQNVLGPFINTWTDLSVTPERISDAGEVVVVHGRYRGKHKGTRRPFESRFVHTWTLENGKAIRFEMLADTIQFFRSSDAPRVLHRRLNVDGLDIFFREAGPKDAPTILLLHGFPTSSHMFRKLIPLLAERFHVVAPDYPGFGLSSSPSPDEFSYSFDGLTDVIEKFTERLGLSSYHLYLQDYGAPVGFRLATRHPERVAGLIVQNGNIYEEGLSENLAPLVAYITNPNPETEQTVRGWLTAATTRFQYNQGAPEPDEVEPETWVFDQYHLDRPGNDQIQLSLFRDYGNNLPLYAKWQEYLRKHQPRTLIAWGENDPFFTPAGAQAFLRDVPNAKLNLLDGGHFALETHSEHIAYLIKNFLEQSDTSVCQY